VVRYDNVTVIIYKELTAMTVSAFFIVLALLCMAGVVVVFIRGMAAMSRGQKADHAKSNNMMKWRIMLQGGAIFFLFLAYLSK
jgi:hypothetical protein